MTSKLDYLKKYLSTSDVKQLKAQVGKGANIKIKNTVKSRKKHRKKSTQQTGFILGDVEGPEKREESSDWSDGEGPTIVEFRDESRERMAKMWHPVSEGSSNRARHDSDSDVEARRDGRHSDSDLDVSRKGRHDSNNLTPPQGSDSDLEVKRKPCSSGRREGKRGSRWSREDEGAKPKDCVMVLESQQQDNKTVYRDKQGHKIDTEREAAIRAEEERAKAERDAKFQVMKSGLAQAKMREERSANFAEEASRGLARYKGDERLNEHLKAKELLEDPLIRMKSKESKKKEGDKRCKPTYQGHYPNNRFGIRPGYRWDGVDRSNGFEKERFQIVNSRRADHEEYYKWSVEDM